MCGLEAKLFGLGLGLVEIGLVASNMTLINIYSLVIDVQLLSRETRVSEVQRLLGVS